ncbi:hypothetical protein GZ78_27135 [Endozoicomonas numazuensis]|uniref:Uncharacterized protein n=2 Tax=Endozoicomonas numazuensis TaxID=1137799 RepID=A0A081N434_9GAMM|nr:hypothetical protein GZ78_27135 [Endozoicomonas numazuensis]
MGLGITGEALFQQIILLAWNTLNESPETLSLLNSILANGMSSIEELAALAFVEYAGFQMWGHTGMLPLIAWWFGSPVLVTTPATW